MKSSEKLVIGKTRIEPGDVLDIRLKISETYTGDPIAIPLRVVRAPQTGPTVFVCAAVHGNELSGTGIVHELMYQKKTRQITKGTVILIPVVNVFGFENNQRYLPDRRDLNRCFPGNLKGSLARRIAATFMREIVRKCDYGIDLHSAAQQRTNYPNVRGDCSLPRVEKIARAFGSRIILPNKGPVGSLRRAACRARCFTINVEAGAPSKMESSVIEFGVRGVENVLIELGMLEGSQKAPLYQAHLKKTTWVRAQVGGILRFHILPSGGDRSGHCHQHWHFRRRTKCPEEPGQWVGAGHGHHAHRQTGRTGVPSGYPYHSFSQDSQEPQEIVHLKSARKDSAATGRRYFLCGEVGD
jgi:predicted deacylase